MKYVTFPLYAFISLFLLPISTASTSRKASPLEFFKQFQGLQKGDKVPGLHALKKHLQVIGYFDKSHGHDDYFDDNLESAIKTYQINFNLIPTGILDLKTVSTMSMPRCGVPDITNGSTGMRSGYVSSGSSIHSHYTFFPGTPKWPSTKEIISYAFRPGTRPDVQEPVRQALLTWSAHTPFAYELIQDYDKADIKISFQRRDHGDGLPFDGPLNLLAHAFAPTDGRFHYDADENWTFGAAPGAVDMQTVALHELGHCLGLDHTSDEAAIMYPQIPVGGTKGLNDDDIQGIQALYPSS